jgi:hypothetical protein
MSDQPASPDQVNHPPHYRQLGASCPDCNRPIECIDVVEHLPACLANAVKYIWRCDHKHPDPTEDLRKAIWYLEREIGRRDRMRGAANPPELKTAKPATSNSGPISGGEKSTPVRLQKQELNRRFHEK